MVGGSNKHAYGSARIFRDDERVRRPRNYDEKSSHARIIELSFYTID
jgi:hypothetical protein